MSSDQQPQHPPIHNMVFTMPRTASHLLLKLLNLPEQSSIMRHPDGKDGYIFFPAAMPRFKHALPGKPMQDWVADEKSSLKQGFQACFDDYDSFISSAEAQGKSTLIKEHLHFMLDPIAEFRTFPQITQSATTTEDFQVVSPSAQSNPSKHEQNITCIPDAFLLSRIKPTFLIRHPALTFPSSLRTAIAGQGTERVLREEDIHRWECTFEWTLALYEFYVKSYSLSQRQSRLDDVAYPIVLDAADLGNEALVKKYARAVGLDENNISFAWEAAGEAEVSGLGKMEKLMKVSILGSRGVEKGKLEVGEVDIERLGEAWKGEFGEVLGERLIGSVSRGLDAYDTLMQVRLRVE